MIRSNFSYIILGLVLSIFPITSQAQTINEYSTVDSLRVGDTFDFSITLNRDREYDDIIFPDSSDLPSNFEVRSQSQFKVTSFKDSVHYKLQFFATADTVLPKLPVSLVQGQDTTTLYTNLVPVGFQSVLASQDESLRPLKPIFDFAAAWWPYILAFLLLCIAGYFLYTYFTKPAPPKAKEPEPFVPTPFVDPLQNLQQHIAHLEQMKPSTHEEFKEFYIELGDAIRQYFEDLHHIPALESTSSEILQNLKNQSIDKQLVDDTRAVLQEADMVKFAKFTPTTEQAGRALEKAHNFLEQARNIDAPRVEQLRREHQSNMETLRERHEQQNAEEVTA
ncbi:hypothetical protein [Fodinibius salsisoli]|uniref:Protein BatD n=1 Tax=Fodinibius salsisoli TaxID=2820877 RepID=A0ABT3PN16_9BACT|nr:hypothetical protein [Fodinibius salsisoli]MCW9707340.1 hypothetical protein [Fodinibius salsisoli]